MAVPSASAAASDASLGRRRSLNARRRAGEAAPVRAARRGSEDAVAELFRRPWDRLHRASLLITADAAAAERFTQEAFHTARRAVRRFLTRRPPGPVSQQ